MAKAKKSITSKEALESNTAFNEGRPFIVMQDMGDTITFRCHGSGAQLAEIIGEVVSGREDLKKVFMMGVLTAQ